MSYVRRLTRRGDLTYHAAHCRHLEGRDAEPVELEEVQAAARLGKFTRRRFRGRTVAVTICQSCCPPLPNWPPSLPEP